MVRPIQIKLDHIENGRGEERKVWVVEDKSGKSSSFDLSTKRINDNEVMLQDDPKRKL